MKILEDAAFSQNQTADDLLLFSRSCRKKTDMNPREVFLEGWKLRGEFREQTWHQGGWIWDKFRAGILLWPQRHSRDSSYQEAPESLWRIWEGKAILGQKKQTHQSRVFTLEPLWSEAERRTSWSNSSFFGHIKFNWKVEIFEAITLNCVWGTEQTTQTLKSIASS